MAQPYYVLRQLVGREGWKDLLDEAVGFQNQTAYDCRITDAGELPPDQTTLKTCLLTAYQAQRQVWLRRLWGPRGGGSVTSYRAAHRIAGSAAGAGISAGDCPDRRGLRHRHPRCDRRLADRGAASGHWIAGRRSSLLGVNVLTATRSAPSSEPASRPAPMLSGPQVGQPATAFDQGLADRKGWETWFNALSSDRHEGARYWSAQRSLPKPGSCFGPGGQSLGDWTAGCIAAQQRLAPTMPAESPQSGIQAGVEQLLTTAEHAPSSLWCRAARSRTRRSPMTARRSFDASNMHSIDTDNAQR